MKKINVCLSQQQLYATLTEELTAVGYIAIKGNTEDNRINEHISIIDKYYLEKYPTLFNYPILYSDQVAEETMQAVVQYPCSGIIDSSCKGGLLKSVVEVCLARKKERELLLKENQKLNSKLQDRRIIEKAKFVLMKRLRTSEEEAYGKMRSKAMREQKSLREIADLVLLSEE